jgi:hypothetical protein
MCWCGTPVNRWNQWSQARPIVRQGQWLDDCSDELISGEVYVPVQQTETDVLLSRHLLSDSDASGTAVFVVPDVLFFQGKHGAVIEGLSGWAWIGFLLFLAAMLALDPGIFHRRSHVV